jgi:putative transposase
VTRCTPSRRTTSATKTPSASQTSADRNLPTISSGDALVAFDTFVEIYAIKYEKAVECLIKDRDALLAFYNFPAEHWKHLRTTNPAESTFATVRHRTVRSKRGAYRTKLLSPWSSSLHKRPRNIGVVSTDKANCQRSFSE